MYGDYQSNELQNDYDSRKDEYLRKQAEFMGNKIGILFKLQIAMLIVGLVIILLSVLAGVIMFVTNGSTLIVYLIIVPAALITLGLGIYYGVTLISMKEYDERYSTAGVLYIIYAILNSIHDFFSNSDGLGNFINLIGAVVAMISLMFFINAITEDVAPFDGYISESWNLFKKTYIGMVIGLGVGLCLTLIRFFGLAMLVIGICTILGLVVGIWQIVLLYKTSESMKRYTYRF